MKHGNPTEAYISEAEDLLTTIEEDALDLDNDPTNKDSIDRLFRAFHTIKGSGAMFGFDDIAAFTHHIETLLDRIRDGELSITSNIIAIILKSKDHIKSHLDGSPDNALGEDLIAQVNLLVDTQDHTNDPSPTTPTSSDSQTSEIYNIRFKPAPGIFTSGLDPEALLEELEDLGTCTINIDTVSIPSLQDLKPDECHLAYEIELTTVQGLDAIKDVFIFVEGECELDIQKIAGSDAKEQTTEHADTLEESADIIENEAQSDPSANTKTAQRQANVRVPSEKLDRLVTLVGELVMNQSRLCQVASDIENAELDAPVEEIERLVSELRDNVLGIRMMPIGTTFSRFRRLVHDLSNELGKEIELITEGEETELDKTVLDQLGDPLVHLIRNSLDHGIESPEERQEQGKQRTGSIRLTASHEGAQVVVKITDDGRGLDAKKIFAKAVEKGLASPESNLSETEIYNLIFKAGFSTAKTITNVSGRGVGMDVVKRQIESLRGDIKIESNLGRGTTIALTLPLTLAIIDGQLVDIAGDRFILPMSAVTEIVEITAAERSENNGRNLVNVRGELVPYIRLRELFSLPDYGETIEKVVIVNYDGQRIGFVVDRVFGSHQTVIQSLGSFYKNIKVASGSTIMGDGKVALILDIAGLVKADAKCLTAIT